MPELGSLLYLREGGGESELRWTPATPLTAPPGIVHAWDGSQAERAPIEPVAEGVAAAQRRLPSADAIFVAHRPCAAHGAGGLHSLLRAGLCAGRGHLARLAERGVWVEGCADGLGFAQLESLLREPLLQLPPPQHWTVLTHAAALEGWSAGQAVATYRHASAGTDAGGPPAQTTHCYWHSGAQFERWRHLVGSGVHHACGPGKTHEHLRHARVQNLSMFPSVQQWRSWLQR